MLVLLIFFVPTGTISTSTFDNYKWQVALSHHLTVGEIVTAVAQML